MKLLCISFGLSSRILGLINYIKINNPTAKLLIYNFLNPVQYNELQQNILSAYDGIFLLSIGSELSENPLKKKMSIDQLIEKYPEKMDLLSQLLINNQTTPVLGICYGAQILNYFYDGIQCSQSLKRGNLLRQSGIFKTVIDTQNPIFLNMTKIIYPQYNSVYTSIDFDSTIIAINVHDNTPAAYQYSTHHYGIRFHIQKSDPEYSRIIDNFLNIVKNNQSHNVFYIFLLLLIILFAYKYRKSIVSKYRDYY